MRNFSIAALMGAIIVIAVGLAALRNASDMWAGGMFLVTLCVLGTAVLGAFKLHHPLRDGCQGFALFGCTYTLIILGPFQQIGPILPTTQLLAAIHERVTPFTRIAFEHLDLLEQRRIGVGAQVDAARRRRDPALADLTSMLKRVELEYAALKGAQSGATSFWIAVLPGAANLERFQQIGHCLFALLGGIMGALVSLNMYAMRRRHERHEPPIAAPSQDACPRNPRTGNSSGIDHAF
jgi:hypothetical protein